MAAGQLARNGLEEAITGAQTEHRVCGESNVRPGLVPMSISCWTSNMIKFQFGGQDYFNNAVSYTIEEPSLLYCLVNLSDARSTEETTLGSRVCEYNQLNSDDDEDIVTEVSSTDLGHHCLTYVKTFFGSLAADKLRFVRRVRHEKFVDVLSIFSHPGDEEVTVIWTPQST